MHTNAPIRVTIVIEATVGGTREHLRQLTHHLDRSRFELTVICANQRTDDFDDDIEVMRGLGINVIVRPMKRAISPIRDAFEFCWLVRHLRTHPCDVIHTHSSKAGILGRAAAAVVRVPLIVHTPHTLAFQSPDCTEFSAGMYRLIERFAGSFTDRLVALSDIQKQRFEDEGLVDQHAIAVIPNGVSLKVEPEQLPSDVPELSEGQPIVGFVGRLTLQKGLPAFRETVRRVCAKHNTVKFLVLGDGEERKRLQTELDALGLTDRVRLLGHRNDVRCFYPRFDLLMMTSDYEGLPYVVLEAMSASVPVVAFDLPELRPAVINGETGCLVPMGECGRLADAIVALVNNSERRQAMGTRARNLVQRTFSTGGFIRAHEILYASALTDPDIRQNIPPA